MCEGLTSSRSRDSSVGTGWTVRGSNSDVGETFRTHPDRLWGLPSFLYSGYRVFLGGKAAEAWRWPPTTSRVEVKERLELYHYTHPWPSWPILGWTLLMSLPLTSSAQSLLRSNLLSWVDRSNIFSYHVKRKIRSSVGITVYLSHVSGNVCVEWRITQIWIH
jgi:hypothetical protein